MAPGRENLNADCHDGCELRLGSPRFDIASVNRSHRASLRPVCRNSKQASVSGLLEPSKSTVGFLRRWQVEETQLIMSS